MEEFKRTLRSVIQSTFAVEIEPELGRPEEQFGDYATNVALQLAGRLGRNPRQVAEELAAKLRTAIGDQAREVSVAGPGFVNISLSDKALAGLAMVAPTTKPQAYSGRTVLVEYSDPNPLKPLHAGHLYTTLVGDAIARLVEMTGAKTVRLNYGGDVGLHVAKSMWATIKHLGGELPEKLAELPEGERPAWLGARYVEGNVAYEDDAEAKAAIVEINKRVYKIHTDNDHDSPFAQIYWTCRQWSYDYFADLYRQLEVVPFDRFIPESEVTSLGLQTVREQLDKGVYHNSDGAVVFDGTKHDLHTRVFINSAGLPTYEAKDVGLSLTKWRDYHFDTSIIITANEQSQYMQVVLASLLQFAPDPAKRTMHLTHGVVKLQGGVKMSSRRGNVITATDILEAAHRAGQAGGTHPNEETILAAVKYAFTKNRICSDIIYDPEESVALEGNSGPYLQYAHARARSILAKADSSKASITDLDDHERSLARKIGEYPEVLQKAVDELLPHHICTYLYELAQTFNRFYEQAKVVGDPRQQTRLMLVELYADVLRDGLALLGITAPEKM